MLTHSGLYLEDIGVVQTDDPRKARSLEQQSLRTLQMTVNSQYAISHGGSVSYDGNHASYLPDNTSQGLWNPGEIPFNGYFDNQGILTWWYGAHYSLPAESAGTSVEAPDESTAPDQSVDYKTVDITVGQGWEIGAAFSQDKLGRCFFGLHGGAGKGVLPFPSGSYTSGQVFDANGNRASDPDTIKTALTGWSVNSQVTLPTADTIAVSGSADPIVGAIPNGPRTIETGHSTGIISASLNKGYSIKVPKGIMFPVNQITRCK